MAKGKSQQDLDERIVSSAPAAARVAETSRLVPVILLRHDARVQQWYADWRAICGLEDLPHRVRLLEALQDTWAEWSPTPGAVLQDPAVERLRDELRGCASSRKYSDWDTIEG